MRFFFQRKHASRRGKGQGGRTWTNCQCQDVEMWVAGRWYVEYRTAVDSTVPSRARRDKRSTQQHSIYRGYAVQSLDKYVLVRCWRVLLSIWSCHLKPSRRFRLHRPEKPPRSTAVPTAMRPLGQSCGGYSGSDATSCSPVLNTAVCRLRYSHPDVTDRQHGTRRTAQTAPAELQSTAMCVGVHRKSQTIPTSHQPVSTTLELKVLAVSGRKLKITSQTVCTT